MRPEPSPYGDHVRTITVITTAQVKEGRDIIGGHGGAHVPRDHSDPGGRDMANLLCGHHSLPPQPPSSQFSLGKMK